MNDPFPLLIACCQSEQSAQERTHLLATLSRITDHTSLITAATAHGILPLVYQTLKSLSPHDALTHALKPYYQSIARHNMFMSAELLRILKRLHANGIEALAFKGPTLSQIAYGEITLRQYGDLDFLIRKADRKKVESICLEDGYEALLSFTTVQERAWYTHAKDMSFVHSRKGMHIEMHWLLLDDDYPIQIDLEAVWKQAQSIHLNGYPVQTFSTQSLLIYLCIHGSKHLWERIGWVKDIDQLIRTQTIEWEKITRELKQCDCRRMVLLGLSLSHSLFQTFLPEIIKVELQKEKTLPKLSDFVFSSWKEPQNMFLCTAAMLHLFPTMKMKARYLHKIVLKPSMNEYRFIDLPESLYRIYYWVRPYLLMKKYLTQMLRR